MLSGIRKLFGKSEVTASPSSWLRDLGETSIFVISATVSEGIDASAMTKDQLLAEVRQALERDKENQQKGYGLFVYVADGQRRLPFSASNGHAQKFCGGPNKRARPK